MPPKNLDLDLGGVVGTDCSPTSTPTHDAGITPVITEATHSAKRMPLDIVWFNVAWYIVLHTVALSGLCIMPWEYPLTWLWTLIMYTLSALGITAGAHRLWSHRSYRAKLPLRIFLAACQTMAGQNSIIEWSRDHRVHHKFSETDADPHNACRGFFFAHMGWLLVRKHPDVRIKGQNLSIEDLKADPVCSFQKKYYLPLVLLFNVALPTLVPWYFWGENLLFAYLTSGILRYVASLNATWLVNSAAHMWGNKPYDRHINPVENFFVTFSAIGEGFHNYHHTFPQDYSTSEFGWKLNVTTIFIDAMSRIGQASDCKKMAHSVVFGRRQRTGDGSKSFGVLGNDDVPITYSKSD